jgi:hypothetical protein
MYTDDRDNKRKWVYSGGICCPYCEKYGMSTITKKINQAKLKCICDVCLTTFVVVIKEPYQLCSCIDTETFYYPLYCDYCANGRVVDFIEAVRGIGGMKLLAGG